MIFLFTSLFLQILPENVYLASTHDNSALAGGSGTDYRDTVDPIEPLDPIKDLFQLKQVPHYSTLRKFMTWGPSILFVRILEKS